MLALKVNVTGHVGDDCVECRFHDVDNHEHIIHADAYLFELNANSKYPREELILCQFMGMYEVNKKYIVQIDTAEQCGIFTTEGKHRFEIWMENVIEID